MSNAVEMLREQAESKRQELLRLEQAIALLEGDAVLVGDPGSIRRSNEYEGLGISDAAARFIKEMGQPLTTREIADALMNRGLKTRSKNFGATVYATLDNSKRLTRTSDGRWEPPKD